MSTEAPDRAAALMEYAERYRSFEGIKQEYDEWKASGQAIEERYQTALEEMRPYAEAAGDPFQLFKGQRRSSGTRERNPERKKALLTAIQNEALTAKQIAEITGEDPKYIAGTLQNEKKAGRVTASGERGSMTYRFTGESVEVPEAA